MKPSTLDLVRCLNPECTGGELELAVGARSASGDIQYGELLCVECEADYPILAGVALLVPDVEGYLLEHIQGVSSIVREGDFPKEYRTSMKQAARELRELGPEHIEDGLESDRINALYLTNHYLEGADVAQRLEKEGAISPVIKKMILDYWDQGPMSRVAQIISESPRKHQSSSADSETLVELGCGVGGLARSVQKAGVRYLGIDSSFLSIWHARRLNSGHAEKIKTPGDLLHGPQTIEFSVGPTGLGSSPPDLRAVDSDFIVGQIDIPPILAGAFDWSLSLNTMDMLEEPARLPFAQWVALKSGGQAIQTCPYIWHPEIARQLRDWASTQAIPDRASTSVVQALYERQGFRVTEQDCHVPWLFLKHARQLEIYDVHVLTALKP